MSTFFVSDLHFGLLNKNQESLRERSFVKFLNSIQPEADKLFIVGDLFDFWFEYKKVVQKGYFRTFTALQDLVEANVEVHFFVGNHDFMHRDFFAKEIGMILHEEPISLVLDEKKFFIGHGDGLVQNDIGYNILKKILRNKFLQKLYSYIHPDLGIWLASSSSKKSRDYTTDKSFGEKDGLLKTAKDKLMNGYDFVIFGHTHVQRNEKIGKGKYINLGTWLTKPLYAVYNEGNLDLIEWKSND